jgi:hypothetical protein
MYKYCEAFHTVHFRVTIIPLIFQLNVHYIVEYYISLPTLSYMFWCVLHHPQGELHITCCKPSAFYKFLTLVAFQNIKYVLGKFKSYYVYLVEYE